MRLKKTKMSWKDEDRKKEIFCAVIETSYH